MPTEDTGSRHAAGSGSRLRRLVRLVALDLAPLRGREFRLLFIGTSVSFFGGRIRQVAIPFQVYLLTRSPFAVGALGLVEIAPIVALGLVGGALADA